MRRVHCFVCLLNHSTAALNIPVALNGVSVPDSSAVTTTADRSPAAATTTNPSSMLMRLRKAANHELLLSRVAYSEDTLRAIAEFLRHDPAYADSDVDLIFDDLLLLGDYQIHNLCVHHDVSGNDH